MKTYIATRPCTFRNMFLQSGDAVQVDDKIDVKHPCLKPKRRNDKAKGTFEVKPSEPPVDDATVVAAPVVHK